MADILSDIYPIPVSFVDGQQPTARFLNAWAAQIDVAFAVLARIIGDFDGESSEQPTYISNLVRTIGSMGWLNSRLPRGLCAGLVDGYDPDLNPDGIFPTLIETLSSGTKEAMLTFLPRDVSTTVDAGTISGWSKVNVGISTNPGSNFDAVNQWTNWSRKVYTTTTIPAGAQIQYEVDTDFGSTNAQDYYDAYSPNSGANVIPNLYEIASVVAGGGGALTTLCSYTEVVDELWIEFPDIRRAMNPALPFSTTNNILNLVDGTVHWVDGFTPRYTVPSYIFDIANAEADDQIPEGLCSLWIAGAAQTTRLVNQNSEEQIRFFIDPADRRHVRIELPPDFVLPHIADAGLTERYIIAFASVGLADALLHERSRMIKHTHDGTGEDSLIRAVSLTERFNPSQYTQSIISHNHFPQYLLRSGYSYDSDLAVATDTLNRSNALLGPLLIGSTSATPSNTVNPSTPGTTSYSICLGSYGADSPAMYFSHADNPSGDAAYDSTGKIQLINKSVRIDQMLFLGAQSNGGWISATDGYFAFGPENSGATTGASLEAGTFVTTNSLIEFGGTGIDADATLTVDEGIVKTTTLAHGVRGIQAITSDDLIPQTLSDLPLISYFIHPTRWTPAVPTVSWAHMGTVTNIDPPGDWEGPGAPAFDLADNNPIGWWSTPGIGEVIRFIVPIDIQESRSASNLGGSDQIRINEVHVLAQNISGSAGIFQLELFEQNKATGATTRVWISPEQSIVAESIMARFTFNAAEDDPADDPLSAIVVSITDNAYYFKLHCENDMGFFGLILDYNSGWIG